MICSTGTFDSPYTLHFCAIPWHQRSQLKLSEFDIRLRREWQNSLSTSGAFLHGVESEPNRMSGSRGFVAVLCRNRANRKRKPQSFVKILQELDPKSFNFTKVKPEEVLFQLKTATYSSTDDEKYEPSESSRTVCDNVHDSNGSERTIATNVIINNSPYEFGHCLLVPEPEKLHIQSITLDVLKMGIDLLLYSSHPGFRVMYNSLCAGASVNHLHIHCYYTEYWLSSEAIRMKPLQSFKPLLEDCFELEFADSCVRGFGFVITKENHALTLPRMLYKIVQYFNAKNVAHNIVIIRGLPPSEQYLQDVSQVNGNPDSCNHVRNISDNPNIPALHDTPLYYDSDAIDVNLRSAPLVGRVYIFPRVPLIGEKCYRKFLVNVTELFGHLYFGDVGVFDSMSESDVAKAMNSVSLSKEEFAALKNDVIEIIGE